MSKARKTSTRSNGIEVQNVNWDANNNNLVPFPAQRKKKEKMHLHANISGKKKPLNLKGEMARGFRELTQRGGLFTDTTRYKWLEELFDYLRSLKLRIMSRTYTLRGREITQYWLLDKVESIVEVRA